METCCGEKAWCDNHQRLVYRISEFSLECVGNLDTFLIFYRYHLVFQGWYVWSSDEFLCLTRAAVRSEQWVSLGWATFAALAFHRSRSERSCTLTEAGICSREQLYCFSCQRKAQPGNVMPIPSPICCDTSVHPQSCLWHSLCAFLLKLPLAAPQGFCMNFDCAFASEYSEFQCTGVM